MTGRLMVDRAADGPGRLPGARGEEHGTSRWAGIRVEGRLSVVPPSMGR